MLPHGFLDRYESELGLIQLQTQREYEMQWRQKPENAEVSKAVTTSEKLNQHLSKSIQMLRAQQVSPVQSPTEQPTKVKPMTTGFAAEIKAMLDGAKANLSQARADGKAKVQAAVTKFAEATAATAKVSESMAKTIEEEAASAMSELGQISNDLTGEA